MAKGQIWIETVLYTLIGIALIGVVLAIATPKINQARDRILVEQTLKSLSIWDEKIGELLDKVPGNVRSIPAFTMKRGELTIEGSADEIVFRVDGLSAQYSELGYPIREGNVVLTSYKGQKDYYIIMELNYSRAANITYSGLDASKKFTAASTPYTFSLKSLEGSKMQIDIEETTRG